ncbi:hypothetical protein [Rufibacter roseolus]|uniref:hypothetical protein n=1 Tax=Rufibacter roseolus TaxID=2817375 RepID=UPI001B30C6D5|nr:hypothetical protein [Rufibacter roseolus]
MEKDSLSTKEMLLNIASMRKKALALSESGKRYSHLLKLILEKDFFYDENQPMPSLKELCQTSGLKSGKVRKFLEEVYNDLVLDYETKPVFTLSKVRYEFYLRGWDKKVLDMEVDCLPVIPRAGEEIEIPFFSAYLKVKHFFVEKIRYRFEEDTQYVTIWLQKGFYNPYWEFRKAQAVEEDEISTFEALELEDFELKRRLRVGRN